MDAALLKAIHEYVFVLLAVVGACWIVARVGLLIGSVLMALLEMFADKGE